MTSKRVASARDLRQRSSLAEQKVWPLLRGGRIDGLKFRRQHPIGRYVVDFACDQLRLAIEIDGSIHGRDDIVTSDHLRQTELERLGWTVLRFPNEIALALPADITEAIRQHARSLVERQHIGD